MYGLVLGVVVLGAGLLIHQYPSRALTMLIVVARALCGVKRPMITIDGRNWTYLDSVKEFPATLVLLHGFGADKDTWLPYARLLRKRMRVIAPDLPGFGESPMDPGLDYTVEEQCLRLQHFISGLGLGRVHLVGNSLGGFIATWFALEHPDMVASITLIDAAGMEGADKSETDRIIERGENPFAISDFASFKKFMSCVTYEQPRIPKFIMRALYLDAIRRQSFLTGLFWKLLHDMRSRNLLAELHRLKSPTLVIWGREDRLVDVSSATAIHGRVPGSKLVILDKIGHAPMIEAPGVTAAHQGCFIDGLTGSQQVAAA